MASFATNGGVVSTEGSIEALQAGLDTPRRFWTFCEVEPVALAVIEDGVSRVDELLCAF